MGLVIMSSLFLCISTSSIKYHVALMDASLGGFQDPAPPFQLGQATSKLATNTSDASIAIPSLKTS